MSKQPILKGGDLIEACLEGGDDLLYVELPNGHRIPIIHYHHARNERGQDILVLHAGNNRRAKQHERMLRMLEKIRKEVDTVVDDDQLVVNIYNAIASELRDV